MGCYVITIPSNKFFQFTLHLKLILRFCVCRVLYLYSLLPLPLLLSDVWLGSRSPIHCPQRL